VEHKEFLAIRERLKRIRKRDVVSPMGVIPASIEFLDRAIHQASVKREKRELYLLLIGECVRCQRGDLEMEYRRRQRADFPGDPFVLTSFALALAYDEKTQAEALAISHEAIAAAVQRGTWIRYCFTRLARVAIAVGDGAALAEALEALVKEGGEWREEDYHLEFDFLEQIRPGSVDPALLEAYRALGPTSLDEST